MDSLPVWLRPAKTSTIIDERTAPSSNRHVGKGPDIRTQIDEDEDLEIESTPKAGASHPGLGVPTFSLYEDTNSEEQDLPPRPSFGAPSFPVANSAQRASPIPRAAPVTKQNGNPKLMPPPPRPTPAAPTSVASFPRVPSTGPLPNRGPPPGSQQRVSSSNGNSLNPNTTNFSPNSNANKPSKKVLLSPGHSPMDWAALISNPATSFKLSGLPNPGQLLRVTPSHLKRMTGRRGKPAWSSWQGKVYNLTPYLPFHPGGEAEILRAAGRDGTSLFMDVHPWVNWEGMLGACLVGVMVSEDDRDGEGLEGLD